MSAWHSQKKSNEGPMICCQLYMLGCKASVNLMLVNKLNVLISKNTTVIQ